MELKCIQYQHARSRWVFFVSQNVSFVGHLTFNGFAALYIITDFIAAFPTGILLLFHPCFRWRFFLVQGTVELPQTSSALLLRPLYHISNLQKSLFCYMVRSFSMQIKPQTLICLIWHIYTYLLFLWNRIHSVTYYTKVIALLPHPQKSIYRNHCSVIWYNQVTPIIL